MNYSRPPFFALVRALLVSFALLSLLPRVRFVDSSSFASPVLDFDPYSVLGVSRRSTADQIKAAYRRKAREHHPDKNPDVDPDVCSERFRKVAEAFEVLSDEKRRKRYDRQQQQQQQHNARRRKEQQQRRQRASSSASGRRREGARNDGQETGRNSGPGPGPGVRRAQSRVVRVSSLAQLEAAIPLGRGGRLERHLLMAFVGNKNAERILDDVLRFPYPFAGGEGGSAGGDGVPWDDLLRSVKVRYNKPSDLTRFFRAPSNEQVSRTWGRPFVVFVRRGDRLEDFVAYSSKGARNPQGDLEGWVRTQLRTRVAFVNRHNHIVELFRVESNSNMRGFSYTPVASIAPGATKGIHSAIGQEFIARDQRVDRFPGATSYGRDKVFSERSSLGRYRIEKHDQSMTVRTRKCVDLSGRCDMWKRSSLCQEMPEFMSGLCASTCGFCVERPSLLEFVTRYFPEPSSQVWFSGWLRSSMKALGEDIAHISAYRKNAGFMVALLGFGLGFAVIASTERPRSSGSALWPRSFVETVICWLFVFLPLFCIVLCLVASAPLRSATRGNAIKEFVRVFVLDMKHVMEIRKNAVAIVLLAFLSLGLAVGSFARKVRDRKAMSARKVSREKVVLKRERVLLSIEKLVAATVAVALCSLSAALVHIFYDATFLADIDHILASRKNAAFTIALFGLGLGLRFVFLAGGLTCGFSSERLATIVDVAFVCIPLCCFLATPFLDKFSWNGGDSVGSFLLMYQADMMHIATYRKIAGAMILVFSLLFGLVLGITLVLKQLVDRKQRPAPTIRITS